MRLELDDDQRDLAAALRAELADRGDSDRQVLAELDVFALELPADVGGLELGLGEGVIVCEEQGRQAALDGYPAVALLSDLLLSEADTRHTDLLKEIAADGAAVAVTGWDAPIRALRTDAAPALSGDCRLVGPAAPDYVVTSARDQRGPVLAAVAVDGPGVALTPGPYGRVRLDGASPLTIVEGMDPVVRPGRVLARARTRHAAYLLGLSAGAHELAVARAAKRRQFGRAIGENQAVMFSIGRLFAEAEAVRLLVHRAAWLDDRREDAALAATQALAYAAELALETTAWAVHVFGAHGLSRAEPVHRYYALAATEAVRWGSPAALWNEAARLGGLHETGQARPPDEARPDSRVFGAAITFSATRR